MVSGANRSSGIKVGPTMQPEELVRVLDGESGAQSLAPPLCRVLTTTTVVNPDRIPGKVIIIGRYGADKVG
jgi:3-deoxy-7-phosphoheptulonate synthase